MIFTHAHLLVGVLVEQLEQQPQPRLVQPHHDAHSHAAQVGAHNLRQQKGGGY